MITNNNIGIFKSGSFYGGRLGNQMFQYASLLGISNYKKESHGISTDYKSNLNWNELGDRFNFENQNILTIDLCFNLDYTDSSQVKFPVYRENEMLEFDESVFSISNNTDLYGLFQNEMYFVHNKSEVLKQFSFKLEIINKANEYLNNLRSVYSNPIVSVHYRKFDYVNNPGVDPLIEYYNKSKSMFGSNCNFLLFSDDKLFLNSLPKFKNEIKCEENNQFLEMCIMSLCDHNIIANSTYSWWAAYLNKNKSKVVISPKKWYTNGRNLSLKDWILV